MPVGASTQNQSEYEQISMGCLVACSAFRMANPAATSLESQSYFAPE
jgi:hypothetical protein